jgi:hypothetical protein
LRFSWLRQPRPGNHLPGFGTYEEDGEENSTLSAIGGDAPGWKIFWRSGGPISDDGRTLIAERAGEFTGEETASAYS